MKYLLTLCVFLISLSALPAQATVYFSESWDANAATLSARYPGGGSYGGFCCTGGSVWPAEKMPFRLSTSVKFRGAGSINFNYITTPGAKNYNDSSQCCGIHEMQYRSTSPGGPVQEVWFTWYNYMAPGFQGGGTLSYNPLGIGGSNTKGPYMFLYSPLRSQQRGWSFSYGDGSRELALIVQGTVESGYGDAKTYKQNQTHFAQPDGAWVCYEYHIRITPGSSAGLIEGYAQNMSNGGQNYLTTRYTNLAIVDPVSAINNPAPYIMPYDMGFYLWKLYRQHGYGQMYYDEMSVTSTRLGCGTGTGSGGDTTAPAAPTITSIAKTSTTATVTFTGATDVTMGTYLMLRCTGTSCTSHAQVGSVNHQQGVTSYTFNNTGLTPGTVYSYRIRAQDTSGNLALALSNAMEATTDASSALPTMTTFNATSAGGTVTYSSSPATANVRFTFGGGTTSATIDRTTAQLPGGVLTFQWPAGTTYACAYAGSAVPTYNTASNAYICDAVPAQPSAGAGVLQVNPYNYRYLTTDLTPPYKAVYFVGASKENDCTALLCAIQDRINPIFTTQIEKEIDPVDTFDGSSSDIGVNWDAMVDTPATFGLTKVSGVIQATDITGYQSNAEVSQVELDGNQFRCVTIGTLNDATLGRVSVLLRYKRDDQRGYEFRAQVGSGSTSDASIRRHDGSGGAYTTLTTVDSIAWAGGDRLCGYAIGNSLKLYRNESLLLSTTSSTYRHGLTGIMVGATSSAATATVTSTRAGRFTGDIAASLDAIVARGQNFVRSWISEQSTWGSAATIAANTPTQIALDDFPWLRTGFRDDTSTGTTVRVGVYDLDTFNQAFFDRMKAYVILANSKGVTPSIMLFNGWFLNEASLEHSGFSHPFYCATSARCNNEQSVNSDTNGDGFVEESHTLVNGNVNGYQTAYVNKVLDTLNGVCGCIIEVSNEDQGITTDWHNYIFAAIRAREVAMGYNTHMVWFTTYGGTGLTSNAFLFDNPNPNIISPFNIPSGNYVTNPTSNYFNPRNVFLDSDHIAGAVDALWPWRVFLRGLHPVLLGEFETAPVLAAVRQSMAQTRVYAEKMNLTSMYPESTSGTDLFSSTFGMSNSYTGSTYPLEFITLIQTDVAATIDLSKYGVTGATTFDVEYLNVTTGAVTSGGTVTGGAVRSFNPAGSDPMVVYLKATTVPADTVAPVLSGGSPSTVQVAGTTFVSMLVFSSEVCEAKYDTTPGVAHASKASTFSTTNVAAHSTTVGSLTDGSAYIKYVTCKDPTGNISLEYPISWSVASATDITLPPDVGGLVGVSVNSDTAIQWTITPGTADANHSHHLLEISEVITGQQSFLTVLTSANVGSGNVYLQQGLVAGHIYISRVKAVDTAGNVTANWLISLPVNVSLPETMTGITAAALYTNSAVIMVNEASQPGVIGAYEMCVGASCNSGWTTAGMPSGLSVTFSGLTPNTTYGVRGKWVNLALGGISANFSSTLYFTTIPVAPTTLPGTRIQTPFSPGRLPRP